MEQMRTDRFGEVKNNLMVHLRFKGIQGSTFTFQTIISGNIAFLELKKVTANLYNENSSF